MNDERLGRIRWASKRLTFDPHVYRDRRELVAYVDELTGALERARDLAVRAGAFDGESDTP